MGFLSLRSGLVPRFCLEQIKQTEWFRARNAGIQLAVEKRPPCSIYRLGNDLVLIVHYSQPGEFRRCIDDQDGNHDHHNHAQIGSFTVMVRKIKEHQVDQKFGYVAAVDLDLLQEIDQDAPQYDYLRQSPQEDRLLIASALRSGPIPNIPDTPYVFSCWAHQLFGTIDQDLINQLPGADPALVAWSLARYKCDMCGARYHDGYTSRHSPAEMSSGVLKIHLIYVCPVCRMAKIGARPEGKAPQDKHLGDLEAAGINVISPPHNCMAHKPHYSREPWQCGCGARWAMAGVGPGDYWERQQS